MSFPETGGPPDPAFRHSTCADAETVRKTGEHFDFRVDPAAAELLRPVPHHPGIRNGIFGADHTVRGHFPANNNNTNN